MDYLDNPRPDPASRPIGRFFSKKLRIQAGIDTRWTSGSKQIDDALDGCVGAVIGGFQLAGWLVAGGRAVMEAAMSERSAETFVEEEEEEGNLDAFLSETVGVSASITLQ